MLEILRRATERRDELPYGRLRLAFEFRRRSRLRTRLESGEEVAISLARGEVLRGGDFVVARGGELIEVVAAAEKVLHVTCASAQALGRVAYHLGNRHVAVQVGEGWLRCAADSVLEKMLPGLGATVEVVEAPFEPEPGAYAPRHRHDPVDGLDSSGHGGRIHEFRARP